MRPLPICAACLALMAAPAFADAISPTVMGSLYDHAPEDGVVDETSSTMWVYHSSQGDRRGIAEYDVTGFGGATLSEARIAGRLSVNNSLNSGDRIFNVLIYAGNGSMEDGDFNITASIVGSFSYAPPTDHDVDFDFDVLSEAQSLIDGGADFLGFRFEQSNEGAPNVITGGNAPILTIVPEPSTGVLLVAGALALRRRRAA